MNNEQSKRLITITANILNIPTDTLKEIINKDEHTLNFVNNSSMLSILCDRDKVNLLLGMLLFRDKDNFSEITKEEIDFINTAYDIQVNLKINKSIKPIRLYTKTTEKIPSHNYNIKFAINDLNKHENKRNNEKLHVLEL